MFHFIVSFILLVLIFLDGIPTFEEASFHSDHNRTEVRSNGIELRSNGTEVQLKVSDPMEQRLLSNCIFVQNASL